MFALCKVEKLDDFKYCIFYPHAERIPFWFFELQDSLVRSKVQLVHFMENDRLGEIGGGGDS